MTKFQKERIKFLIKEADKGTFVQLGKADGDLLTSLLLDLAVLKEELNNTQVLLESYLEEYVEDYERLKEKYEPTVTDYEE